MSRSRAGREIQPEPELLLQKASLAKTAGLRAKYAKRGLDLEGSADPTIRTMLLRQLYLAAMERKQFTEAQELAHQMVELGVLPDSAHQDAARACLGKKDIDGAARHLRLAARLGPPARRSFHLSMLGSLLYLNERANQALPVLRIAARWSTNDKALCRAQLLIAEVEAKVPGANPRELHSELAYLRESIEGTAHRRGYGEFVLGELCMLLGDHQSAAGYFEDFLARVTRGRIALQVALHAEIRRAKRHLAWLKRRPSAD